jgi:hypothetical protein
MYQDHDASEEARRELAQHYLLHSSLELNETAYPSRLRRCELVFSRVSRVEGHVARGMAGRASPSRQLEPRIGFGCVSRNREIQTSSQAPQCQITRDVMLLKEGPEALAKFRLT